MTQQRDGRRGFVFPLRLTADERRDLEELHARTAGPRGLGPWLQWAAKRAFQHGVLPTRGGNSATETRAVIPARAGTQPVIPGPVALARLSRGITRAARGVLPPPAERVILDLCAGSGAWSEPYRAAGYVVRCIELANGDDVHTLRVPEEPIWGVLAAPPCTEFSIAKNGRPRDFRRGLETVAACARLVLAVRPRWWALENPTGYLSEFLGTPRDVWEPYEFGDPWTKRTAIWGEFTIPERGPFVDPLGSAMDRSSAALRAVTPPGFARAFFEANQ